MGIDEVGVIALSLSVKVDVIHYWVGPIVQHSQAELKAGVLNISVVQSVIMRHGEQVQKAALQHSYKMTDVKHFYISHDKGKKLNKSAEKKSNK